MDLGLTGNAVSRARAAASARPPPAARGGGRGCSASRARAVDVTDPDAAERIVECAQRFGAIDVLVNNAGTSFAKPLDELTDADWQAQWELHVMGPMRLMRAAAPRWRSAGGGGS